MIRLWGRRNSINVMKVVWCLEECGLDYQRIDAGGAFGGTDTAQYLAMNPTGRIPTLADHETVLWESNVIVRYLAARYAPGVLCPEGPAERARAEQWMDWQQTAIHPDLTYVFQGQVRANPDCLDAGRAAACGERLRRHWALADRQLAGRPYLAGDAFTMADIPLGCACWRWRELEGEARPALAGLDAWFERLAARPAYREHVMLPLT